MLWRLCPGDPRLRRPSLLVASETIGLHTPGIGYQWRLYFRVRGLSAPSLILRPDGRKLGDSADQR